MKITEFITAKGSGYWYYEYQVQLATVTHHWTNRSLSLKKDVVSWVIRFGIPGKRAWDARTFNSESARQDFLLKNFTDLSLKIMEDPQSIPVNYFLDPVVGEHLTSTNIVTDYLVFNFNQHVFQYYLFPTIQTNGNTFRQDDVGYKDVILDLVGKKVTSVDEYLDNDLIIDLDDNASIELPFKTLGSHLNEPVEYHGPNGIWNIW